MLTGLPCRLGGTRFGGCGLMRGWSQIGRLDLLFKLINSLTALKDQTVQFPFRVKAAVAVLALALLVAMFLLC